jgi:hypothetical protein
MKRLIAFMALFLFMVNANAVTAAKSSTTTKAAAPITETPVKDDALAQQLTSEVAAEDAKTASTSTAKPMAMNTAPAAKSTSSTETKAQAKPATDGDLNLDDAAIEAESLAAANTMPVQESTTTISNSKSKKEKNWYISGILGTLAYPDVGNINGKYAVMGSLGYIWQKSFVFEAGIGAANYQMEALNPTILNRRDTFEIDQYSATLAAKYRLPFGRIVPSAGVLVQITQRQFTQRDPNNIGNNGITVDRGNSQTTDGGLVGALDFEMNRDFAIGLDVRYIMNLSNNAQEVSNVNSNGQNGYTVTPIEKLQSYSAGVSARMNF